MEQGQYHISVSTAALTIVGQKMREKADMHEELPYLSESQWLLDSQREQVHQTLL
jgi:hypothetical protein